MKCSSWNVYFHSLLVQLYMHPPVQTKKKKQLSSKFNKSSILLNISHLITPNSNNDAFRRYTIYKNVDWYKKNWWKIISFRCRSILSQFISMTNYATASWLYPSPLFLFLFLVLSLFLFLFLFLFLSYINFFGDYRRKQYSWGKMRAFKQKKKRDGGWNQSAPRSRVRLWIIVSNIKIC